MPASDYRPSTQDVASIARERTYTAGGQEAGDFTADTVPTGTQVETLIGEAMDEAYPLFGNDVPSASESDPDALRRSAKRAVAYLVAASLELTHYGKEVARGQSPYDQYVKKWEDMNKRVQDAIANGNAGNEAMADYSSGAQWAGPGPIGFDGMNW